MRPGRGNKTGSRHEEDGPAEQLPDRAQEVSAMSSQQVGPNAVEMLMPAFWFGRSLQVCTTLDIGVVDSDSAHLVWSYVRPGHDPHPEPHV